MRSRLSKFTGARPKLTLAVWLIVTVAMLPFAAHESEHLSAGGYEVAGSESLEAQELIHDRFPALTTEQLVPIVVATGQSPAAQLTDGMRRVRRAVVPMDGVTLPRQALTTAAREVRSGAGVVALPLRVRLGWDRAIDAATQLESTLDAGNADAAGTTIYLAGRGAQAAALQDVSESSLQKAELIGFPILFLLLLLIFGSFTAAVLPLLLAAASLTITAAAIHFISLQFEVSVFSKNMASMIGLGVAIDYSLFLLVRFREELRRGADVEQARTATMRTSGHAVFFSGVTVAVSLAAVFVVHNAALRSMAVGAIIVVLISVAATLTLLPAAMTLLGRRLARRRFGRDRSEPTGFWRRWTVRVMGHPVLALVASAAVLLLFAVPVLSLKTGDDTLRQVPPGDQIHEAAARSAELLGPGADAPIAVAVTWRPDASGARRAAAVHRIDAVLRRDPSVFAIAPPVTDATGDVSVVSIRSRSDYESTASRALVDRVRKTAPGLLGPAAKGVIVGGATAGGNDLIAMVEDSLPLLVAAILVLAYFTLLMLLRSAILPLKAILTNLLSVGAGYGAVVALFQWGWFGGITHLQSLGHVQAMALPLILAVVFGLSMDYEVFLLSRIRERWLATGENRRAVEEGLASTAPVITSAALLMITVFLTFAATGIQVVQQLGIGCAVAIAFDATVTRLVLVPATMELLGSWNWWMPGIGKRGVDGPQLGMDEAPEAAGR